MWIFLPNAELWIVPQSKPEPVCIMSDNLHPITILSVSFVMLRIHFSERIIFLNFHSSWLTTGSFFLELERDKKNLDCKIVKCLTKWGGFLWHRIVFLTVWTKTLEGRKGKETTLGNQYNTNAQAFSEPSYIVCYCKGRPTKSEHFVLVWSPFVILVNIRHVGPAPTKLLSS